MARFGRECGRPCTGLLFILLLSSLEGYALASRAALNLDAEGRLNATGEGSSNVTVARAPHLASSRPVRAFGDDRHSEPTGEDLQCVAVLCWLETFEHSGGESAELFAEANHAVHMASEGAELHHVVAHGAHAAAHHGAHAAHAASHGVHTVAGGAGLLGSIISGIINAIKVKGEGCKGNAFSCIGKASLAVVVTSVLGIVVFIVGNVFAAAATVTAGVGISLGSLGFFFSNVFAYICNGGLNEHSAKELVHQATTSLAHDNPGKSHSLSAQDENRVVAMLAQVQAARNRINGDAALSQRIAKEGRIARSFRMLLGLSTVKDVQAFCDSMQVAFNPRDPRAALREERDGGEYIDDEGWATIDDGW